MPEFIGSSPKKREPILLRYACLAWLVSICCALVGFSLWRLAASAHNVLLYRVREYEDMRRASDSKDQK